MRVGTVAKRIALTASLLAPVCIAQQLAPPLPIPIVLGTPLVVPDTFLQNELHAMSARGCDALPASEQHRLPATTLQDLLGDKVKQIQIIRVTPFQSSLPSVTGVYTPPAVTAVKRALRRHIQASDCTWHSKLSANGNALPEFPSPTVQADIEFEDGIKTHLITDGNTAAAQDRTGRVWFLRLA